MGASDTRVFNFAAGPAVLPEPVLLQAQRDLFCYPGAGASMLEISHRSKAYDEVIEAAAANIATLLGLPEGYHVVFLQGGASLQFSMVPMNLLGGGRADYVVTGSWAKKALAEARREGEANIAWDGKDGNYSRMPASHELRLTEGAAYVHITANETIQGIEFPAEPDTGDVPLVCDASSDFLSRPLDVARYGLIYAGAQKNVGPAGVTIAVIREDMLERIPDGLPTMLDYRTYTANKSLYNTPPAFAIYIVRLVTDWLLNEIGGLAAMQERNREKAALLYRTIDSSDGFYRGHAAPDSRSMMNVSWRLPSEELEKQFVAEARDAGLYELKGHRSVGGIRASIYNAMPREGVVKLVEFMQAFRATHA